MPAVRVGPVRSAWRRVVTVDHPDEDVRRRASVLVRLAACLIVAVVPMVPLALLVPDGPMYASCFLGVCGVYALAIRWGRRGRVELAVTAMLVSYAVGLSIGVLHVGTVTTAPIFCLLMVTLAGTLLKPRFLPYAYALAMVLAVALPLLVDGRTRPVTFVEQLFVVAVVSLCTALTAGVNSVGISEALGEARSERDRARRLAGELRNANDELERRVELRTHQLKELSVRDPLTGLYNRRHADEALAQTLAAATATRRAMAVLAIDIDDFKSVNELHGHAGGDGVLKVVADQLLAVCRPRDVVARVGGEEFLVILPGRDETEAGYVAVRILTALRTAVPPPPLQHCRVTVSIGVAAVAPAPPGPNASTEVPTGEGLWATADARLFAAKRSGKDRVAGAPHLPVQRTSSRG